MRRAVARLAASSLAAMLCASVLLAACAYEPEIERPGGGGTGVDGPPPAESPTPEPATATFSAEGCPIDDPGFCEQAAFLANALVLADVDAVFDLSRPVTWDCSELEADLFPQCDDRERLKGYVVGTHQGDFFVLPPNQYRNNLDFFVGAVDEEFSDEFGGPQMQVLGVSTCGASGQGRSYHLVYLVGLGDPDSTLPADRFIGTYELTEERGGWAVGATYVGLYTDWQLVLDDPVTEIACGDIQPWTGDVPAANPPQSESQPTPSASPVS